MSFQSSPELSESIDEFLEDLHRKGVRLWLKGGELRYKAPKGALTGVEIEKLRISARRICEILKESLGVPAESKLDLRRRFDRTPLTFAQLAHWNAYKLGERRGLRQLASATSLCGLLDVRVLRQSFAEMIRRHEALRTRLVDVGGVPMQYITESGGFEFETEDLTYLSEDLREAEVTRQIEEFILAPIQVTKDPLYGVKLLTLREDEHVLIVAMEHMISDAFSMNVLLRELFTTYGQLLQGVPPALPEIAVQLADYAMWQRSRHPAWAEKHGTYWDARLAGCRRVRFPDGQSVPTANRPGWATVPFKLRKELKVRLQEWCRSRQTTLVMAVFSAYVGLVLRWCNVSDMVVRYQTDGRFDPKLENTIGYFASIMHLRVQLGDGDNFLDVLRQVTQEYCNAYEHADFSYIDSQVPRPGFAQNAAFNWIPAASHAGLRLLGGSSNELTCSPVTFSHPMLKNQTRDSEPTMLLHDSREEVDGGVLFPMNRFSTDTMERFKRNFFAFIEALVKEPEKRLKDISLE